MVMVLFCWARAGKEPAKASIMAIAILVTAILIYPSEFAEPLPAMFGSVVFERIDCDIMLQPISVLVKTLSAYWLTAREILEIRLSFAEWPFWPQTA
jgi:hypothetical protein